MISHLSSPLAPPGALPVASGMAPGSNTAPAEADGGSPGFAQLLGQAQGRQEAPPEAGTRAAQDTADTRSASAAEPADGNAPVRGRPVRPGPGGGSGATRKPGEGTPTPHKADMGHTSGAADPLETSAAQDAAEEAAATGGATETAATRPQDDATLLLASLAATRAGVAAAHALAPHPTPPAAQQPQATNERAADAALGELPANTTIRPATQPARQAHAGPMPGARAAEAQPPMTGKPERPDPDSTPGVAAETRAPAGAQPACPAPTGPAADATAQDTGPLQAGLSAAHAAPNAQAQRAEPATAQAAAAEGTGTRPSPGTSPGPNPGTGTSTSLSTGTNSSTNSSRTGEDNPRTPAGRAQAAAPGAPTTAPTATATAQRADAERAGSAAADTSSRQERSFAAELQSALPTNTGPAAPAAPSLAPPLVRDNPGTPTAQAQLNAQPGSANFAPELGTQITTFVREGIHHARLELNPAEMGPVSVQIQLDGNAAQVRLAAENADTRQALEQAMPQLAGSLREAGLTLSGGGVFEQPRQPQGEAGSGGSGGSGGRGAQARDEGAQLSTVATPPPGRSRGMVDLVA